MSPDLGARIYVMSSYLYYRRASPILGDAQFDKLAKGIVKRWELLDEFRQWQLGNPDDVLATGAFVKVTVAAEQAALAWHKAAKNCLPHGRPIPQDEWRWSPKRLVHWVRADT